MVGQVEGGWRIDCGDYRNTLRRRRFRRPLPCPQLLWIRGRLMGGLAYPLATRVKGDETGIPAICLHRPVLGAAAKEKVSSWVWTQRPADDCSCTDSSVTARHVKSFLALTWGRRYVCTIGRHRARLEALTNWYKTSSLPTPKQRQPEVRSAENDIRLAELAAGN